MPNRHGDSFNFKFRWASAKKRYEWLLNFLFDFPAGQQYTPIRLRMERVSPRVSFRFVSGRVAGQPASLLVKIDPMNENGTARLGRASNREEILAGEIGLALSDLPTCFGK